MDRAVRNIIDAHYEKCIARAVHRMRRVSANGWAGDDSPLRTLWDHWKFEVQEEHSFHHSLIEQMVEDIVWRIVNELPHEDGALMTLDTEAADDEGDEYVFAPDAVTAELMRRVSSRACDEPHRREVQRMLDNQARDRFERDMEGFG